MGPSTVLFLLFCLVSLITEGCGQWYKPWCRLKECCNDRWVVKDLESMMSTKATTPTQPASWSGTTTAANHQSQRLAATSSSATRGPRRWEMVLHTPKDLRRSLQANVYGQHLVQNTVVGSLRGHASHQPQKPLVLSFHGSTGTGKNYVSQWIAKNWFKKGLESKYVHIFSGTKDFPYKSQLDSYKRTLQESVIKATMQCKHQIFIFDEIDSFPPGLLNCLSTFLDHHERVDDLDYRNTIFIFLSNTGDEVLRQITTEFYREGSSREAIRLGETERKMVSSIFSAENMGLSKSCLIDQHLVSHYIPFLPMERQHVRQCIYKEMQTLRNFGGFTSRDRIIDEVMSELQFFGPDDNFSVKGCKNVVEKLNYVYELHRRWDL